ncbi:MAG TPA: 2-oxoacid:acceptor oxidoreductase subunit alpha [Methanofastidiosum sp.]|jgi:2-oxoglutarate ferredoxin oxidoreductase subunit alpha|nr:2-oxoacid:acceptor oxidoreductase subunit alpha [Methanofastidiosum sp.]HPA49119.1 2-oxoacid:acceptor oxidoreductase subunit alpha [Methanofastidiosum sp.]HQK62745.1 2-oxoacid:acceptor oxidoreductase subunit alpha [Methanofastidiosum sp.]HQM95188.1 2-oxoacid:acceptor oxidoreductase subunit alpha [Methanofastidiosum sp.]HQQ48908.1 2-oxoacid:acceptor oxidoreductase subunit alpha [Methanofastidiosum sp.]
MTNDVIRLLGKNQLFIQGDEAAVYGALIADCRFFAGYPITPATEVAEGMAKWMPRLGGVYVQMEDEIASIASVIGASCTGVKSMTATSGPGFSLMQECIGYACMAEIPCVIVNVQRGGPSTGQPTEAAQGDVMQAMWGTHGDHQIIALAPKSVQETLDLTIEAFNLSEDYRVPVILLLDAEIGHMREKVVLPEIKNVLVEERVPATIEPDRYRPYRTGFTRSSKVPEFAPFGSGYRTYVTGLTHDKRGFPVTTSADVHEELVRRLVEKVQDDIDSIWYYEDSFLEDAEIVVVSYGTTSRPAASAVKMARKNGLKVGHLRLITIWPFHYEKTRDLLKNAHTIIVAEMNLGQMIHPITEAVSSDTKVILAPKIGGAIHTPFEILKFIEGEQ